MRWWRTRWRRTRWSPRSATPWGSLYLPGVAGQALSEPYVPGSGDRVPAELRLVLAGYVGIAGGLFATALACAAAAVLVFFVYLNDLDIADDDTIGQLLVLTRI